MDSVHSIANRSGQSTYRLSLSRGGGGEVSLEVSISSNALLDRAPTVTTAAPTISLPIVSGLE